MWIVPIAYCAIGLLIALTGVWVRLGRGGDFLQWKTILLGGLAWPVFLYVALKDGMER